ncbi:MAG: YkvA family protein [Geminicoccaceae bacterium]
MTETKLPSLAEIEELGAAGVDEPSFWRKLGRFAARLPFAEDVVALWYCARDPATPSHVRTLLLGAIAYFVMPIDLVPDFIAGLGFTDDASVIAAVVLTARRHITERHRYMARARLATLAD